LKDFGDFHATPSLLVVNFQFIMTLFVANLNFRLQNEDLQQLFEQFGEVSSAKIIVDHETGRSRGFGFVEMPNDDDANEAITQLNQSEIDGRNIVVKEAEPRRPRMQGGNRNQGYRY
jgi:RNA recognition motif-containing protein